MEVLHPRCAGLDVHKDSVAAAVRLADAGGVRCEVRRFDTTTPGLLALGAWLAECGCTHAAMEATGVYWKPVWHVLSDGDLVLILANAAHVKNLPGRKTDVADASWLAELLAHGLIRPSFVPEPATQALRALLRTRKQLAREQASHVQRLQKTLEDANLKLGSVLTDVMGLSGRAILEALVAGERDPDRLLALVHPRVKAEPARLRAALTGRVTDRHGVGAARRLGPCRVVRLPLSRYASGHAFQAQRRPPPPHPDRPLPRPELAGVRGRAEAAR